MDELYYINEINNYFEILFYYNEASVTETQNFLHNYLNFTLLHNGINPKELNVNFHFFNKPPLDSDHVFNVHKKKQKQPNKENAKKPKFKKAKNFLAFVDSYPEEKRYEVYLNKNKLAVKTKEDFDKLISFIFTIGHEFDHIIQHELNPQLTDIQILQTIKYLSKYNKECELHKEDNSYIRKLTRKISKHNENFLMTTACEKLADRHSIMHFENFLVMTKEYYELSPMYDAFLNCFLNTLQDTLLNRKNDYKICNQQESDIKNSLINNFNFNEDELIIP